jgi:hypothetical protein
VSRRQPLGLAVLLAIALLSVRCSNEQDTSATKSSSATAPSASASVTATTTGETGESAEAPPPFTVEGRGPMKRSITVPNEYRPVIILARWPKRSILEVRIHGEGLDRLKGESGAFLFDGPGGATATPGIASGDYEFAVKGTKGPWGLQFSEPDPDAESLAMLEEPIGYQYDAVVILRLEEATALQWEMQSDALFMPHLLGYGDAEGAELQLGVSTGDGLLLEPTDRGFRSDGAMPAGDYLLVVDADGNWVVTFSPTQ